jgi:hypothetical protein
MPARPCHKKLNGSEVNSRSKGECAVTRLAMIVLSPSIFTFSYPLFMVAEIDSCGLGVTMWLMPRHQRCLYIL